MIKDIYKLTKKDYVQSSNNSTETTTEKSWFEKL